MQTKVLIASEDMEVHQLMCDVLEMNFRRVKIERALSFQSFWAKLPAGEDDPWHLIFLCLDYVAEEPETFLKRVREANPEALEKIILTGYASEFDGYADEIRQLPFLPKPFSLDMFEEMAKAVRNGNV
jgi:DNA-binding NtrC family response regulator